MASSWYTAEELRRQAVEGMTQPEFDPTIEEDPEDTSWLKIQAMIDRGDEIAAIVATITQAYPVSGVSGDV